MSTDATPPIQVDLDNIDPVENKNRIEVENQKFLVRMSERIKKYQVDNPGMPLPIAQTEKGLYFWVSRKTRRKAEKLERAKKSQQKKKHNSKV